MRDIAYRLAERFVARDRHLADGHAGKWIAFLRTVKCFSYSAQSSFPRSILHVVFYNPLLRLASSPSNFKEAKELGYKEKPKDASVRLQPSSEEHPPPSPTTTTPPDPRPSNDPTRTPAPSGMSRLSSPKPNQTQRPFPKSRTPKQPLRRERLSPKCRVGSSDDSTHAASLAQLHLARDSGVELD